MGEGSGARTTTGSTRPARGTATLTREERAERMLELVALRARAAELEAELGLGSMRPVAASPPDPAWAHALLEQLGSDLMSVHASHGVYRYASPNARELFGWSPAELVGQDAYTFLHPEDRARVAAWHVDAGPDAVQVVRYRLRCKDERYRWVETRGRAQRLDDGRTGMIVCLTRDIHEEVRAQQRAAALQREHAKELRRLALSDALTGLPNRRAAEEELKRAWARAERLDEDLCFALVDVDHFKRVNDTHGHATGDEVLRRLGRVLRKTVRAGDFVARWGGEEFLLVLHAQSDPVALVERVRQAVAAAAFPEDLRMTVSAGIAWRFTADRVDEVLEAADEALYDAKAAGRDRVCVASARG